MSTLFTNFFEKINQISPLESKFTEVLDTIAVKPKILYFCGEIPKNMVKTVAIVGSRRNTKYGEEVAYKLAYELGRRGVVIISGLAYGIDSIAHRGCLDAGGTTIAILGTRIDDIYPKTHLSLAQEIIKKGGAIISEYAPATANAAPLAPAEAGWNGTTWVDFRSASSGSATSPLSPPYQKRNLNRKTSFLYRNRLISGLSDIVVVVEAAERSGSLSTATHALEQGKDIFAVPGNITSPYSQGCNKLIQQGATPYTEPSDILRELFPQDYIKNQQKLRESNLIGDTDVETKILQAIAEGARTSDAIMSTAVLPPEVFSQSITLLEIKGRIHSVSGNWCLI